MVRSPLRSNRYAQVALTYTATFTVRIWLACTAAVVAWLLCLREANYAEQVSALILGGTLAGWAGAMIFSHAKEQFADPRARLTPGFRSPHLVVAALLFIAAVIGLALFAIIRLKQIPTVIGWPATGATPVGFLAVVLAATAALVWMTYFQSPTLIFFTIAAGVSLMSPLGQGFLTRVLNGELPTTAAAMLAASVAAQLLLCWRMSRLHEGMVEYWRIEGAVVRLRASMTGDRFLRRAAASETGPFNEWMRMSPRLDRVGRVLGAPFRRRVAHWRLVVGMGRVYMLCALFLALGFAAVWMLDSRRDSRESKNALFVVLPGMMTVALPVLLAGCTWPWRWFVIGTESLRPATRQQFFREQGAAMFGELARAWAWTAAGAYLPGLIFAPAWVLTPAVAALLVLSAACQVFLFGATVWLLRYRGVPIAIFIAALLAVFAAMALVGWQLSGVGKDGVRAPSPLVALAVLVAGVFVAHDAYRRWLVTDLD